MLLCPAVAKCGWASLYRTPEMLLFPVVCQPDCFSKFALLRLDLRVSFGRPFFTFPNLLKRSLSLDSLAHFKRSLVGSYTSVSKHSAPHTAHRSSAFPYVGNARFPRGLSAKLLQNHWGIKSETIENETMERENYGE
jgi:hypothetical protein